MKVLYDARLIAEPYSGLGRFTGALLGALLENHPWERDQLLVMMPEEKEVPDNPYTETVYRFSAKNRKIQVLNMNVAGISLQQHLRIPRWVDRLHADVYFYPHFDAPLPPATPLSFVVHDLQPLLVKDYVRRVAWLKKAYFRWRLRKNLRGASRCFAVSAQTKSDLCNEFGMKFEKKIRVCYEGNYLQNFRPDSQERARLGVRAPYLIYVGSCRPNKNLPFMIEVVREMRAKHGYPGELVMVSSAERYGFDLERHVRAFPWIRLLSGCDDRMLAALYDGADALILLSRYEGFGLPVIEASRFGLPLILSDGGALPEIAPPEACILSLSLSVAEVARRAAFYVCHATKKRNPNHEKKFHWLQTAQICFPDLFLPGGGLLPPEPNYDYATIHSFGREWSRFAQDPMKAKELANLGQQYFRLLPEKYLHGVHEACDFGCGSGRWARLIAPRVRRLHCVDASLEVLRVARRNLTGHENISYHCCSLDDLNIPNETLDFAYCLGVLHHLPHPERGLGECVKKLKPGAPLLLYIYQKIERKPAWRHIFFSAVNILRRKVCKLPGPYLDLVCELLALLVYLPLARLARLVEALGLEARHLPLAFYRRSSFYTMRTDARDRFGTPLEKRYSQQEVIHMMRESGLEKICFSPDAPYWTAIGYRPMPSP